METNLKMFFKIRFYYQVYLLQRIEIEKTVNIE